MNNSPKNNRRSTGVKPRYTQDQRIAAVTAMRAIGRDQPFCDDAIQAARQTIGKPVALATLAKWFSALSPTIDAAQPDLLGRPIEALIAETRDNILARLANVREEYVDHLLKKDVIAKASARDAAVVMGIANDHIIKMTDIDPAVATIIKRLAELCQRTNIDIVGLLEDFESVVQTQLPAIQITAQQIPDKINDR
jgi:hypothetical protein